ncbi:putative RNA-binding protein [Trypanosoma cruzi]|nr:putative RNA-binding protein [Trypanosoma cruzi]
MSYTIQVRGLPEDTREDAVRDFFSRVGDVTHCTLERNAATLSFENEEDFNEALNMDGMEFENGAFIQVEKKRHENDSYHGRSDNNMDDNQKNGATDGERGGDGRDASPRDNRKRFREEFKVAVRNIAENTTEQQLRELFEPLGTIADLFLEPRRRYAFVGFDNTDSLEAALQMTGRELNGVAIEVEKKRTGPRENVLPTKVVVKGMPPNTNEDELRAFFLSAGEPVDVFIHEKKHFAFVGFPNEETCVAALRLHGTELNGSRVDVERRQRQRCFKCDREGHVALQCRAVEPYCRNCGRNGHLSRDCRSGPRDNRRNQNDRREFVRRDYNDRRDYGDRRDYNDRRDYGDRREFVDRRDFNDRRDVDRREDRRRARSRSDSYERHRRRHSHSRSRSPKRFARERDRDRSRSRSPPRRRY